MQQVPVGDSRIAVGHIVSILQCAVNGFLYLVPWAGGAVVIKEIVTVHPVFGPVVLFQPVDEPFFLVLREVQRLLPDVASQRMVFRDKVSVVCGSQLIVGVSQGKAKGEIGGVEIEYAVIENGVNATCEVLVANGSVSEKIIDFTARGACQQADAYGVGGAFSLRLHLGNGRIGA
ncbi:hypothetical protein HMPREF9446_01635 [Bacteroides fluxus YIT 12057]|uniref:Uncharacterized protein n=1 Tax=Bacteroides fluxus YIT 12057 TaxID=763034 RepID=F3PSA1_9BACE|nr:hypothetical protein HMPREF9446_01635 [Bacteroides fluxus YIT 12057]